MHYEGDKDVIRYHNNESISLVDQIFPGFVSTVLQIIVTIIHVSLRLMGI